MGLTQSVPSLIAAKLDRVRNAGVRSARAPRAGGLNPVGRDADGGQPRAHHKPPMRNRNTDIHISA